MDHFVGVYFNEIFRGGFRVSSGESYFHGNFHENYFRRSFGVVVFHEDLRENCFRGFHGTFCG